GVGAALRYDRPASPFLIALHRTAGGDGLSLCYSARRVRAPWREPEKSRRFWSPTWSATAGSPARTKIARWRGCAGCAIEVQQGLIERNAGLPPERRIEFRVGIHLGDVVEEADSDLMGDGVNIAARLEG